MSEEKKSIVLTGIKPTGELHLGNYVGAIKPIIEMIESKENLDVYFFIADYHALTTHPESKELENNIHKMMLSLFSIFASLKNKNNNKIRLYRQSKIPDIFEYNWILSCYTAKGLLNRNHAYKQLRNDNIYQDKDPDKGIFHGLYSYPVLMAADILIMNADIVPIGKDQKAHVIIANEIGRKINHIYKTKHFKHVNEMLTYKTKDNISYPNKNFIIEEAFLLPGTDGEKKMSKSYNNTVSLFDKKEIKKYIFKQKTNFKGEGEKKYPHESTIADIYKQFSSEVEYNWFVHKMESGASWVNLKQIVYDKVQNELEPIQNSYQETIETYVIDKKYIESIFSFNETDIKINTKIRLEKLKSICGIN